MISSNHFQTVSYRHVIAAFQVLEYTRFILYTNTLVYACIPKGFCQSKSKEITSIVVVRSSVSIYRACVKCTIEIVHKY